MADSNESEKLMRNMSIIQEEDVLEINEPSSKDGSEMNSKLQLPLPAVEHDSINSEDSISPNNSPTVDKDTDLKGEDSSRSVKFDNGSEVYDSYSKETTPFSLSVDTPVHDGDMLDTNTQNNGGTPDSSYPDTTSSSPHPSNLPLPTQTETEEELSSATKTKPQEGDQPGHRHFEVSNVDEATLRSQIENGTKDSDLNSTESDPESRPLLEKISSSLSDSDQSTQNAYLDTIGPLEDPRFLKMLNYSVSRTVRDDGFRGASNLDLGKFTSNQPPADMDCGWAWVVLFAAFCSLALTGATTFAAGVLMTAILKIDPDITKASWIGAVHVSVLCISGPFVGVILSCLGLKRTAFCAGIVLATGLFAASFATSILGLIFTHGLIAGLGSGFILNTMFVAIGQYFNRYRGLACGLLATGSGVGMLAGGNALTVLVNTYGLRGTYLLWAGVTLHSLVFAMLLRPSSAEQLREAEKAKANEPTPKRGRRFKGDVGSMRSGTNSIFSRRTNSFKRSQKSATRTSQQDLGVAPLLKSVLHRDMSRSTFSIPRTSHRRNLNIPEGQTVAMNKLPPDSPSTPSVTNPSTALAVQNTSNLSSQDQVDQSSYGSGKFKSKATENIPLLDSTSVSEGFSTDSSPSSPSSPSVSRAPSDINRSFRRRLISGSSQAPSTYTSSGRLSYRPSIREQLQRNDLDNESLASTLVSHLQPQDALSPRYRLGKRSVPSLFGSIASFPSALVIIKDDLSGIDTTDGSKEKSSQDSLRILKNKPFVVFISTCMLWALADSPFSMYLPSYTIRGIPVEASSLYTAMGFGSMCGRFLSGLVASDVGVGPILLHVGCLSIASLVVGFSPWITSTYIEQMACAGLFGLYTGSLVPLSSLITIELLGVGELGLGFGFLSMAQGIGYLAGPPLLGMVIKAFGFEMSFRISGLILFCASMLDLLIAVLIKKEDENIHDSFEDLERALGPILDAESEGENDDVVSYLDEDQMNPEDTDHGIRFEIKNIEKQILSLEDVPLTTKSEEIKEEPPKLTQLPVAIPASEKDMRTISEET